METDSVISFVVKVSEMGERLDSVTASRVSRLSRSLAAALIRKGAVRVEGNARKPGYRVRAGDRINAVIPEPEPVAAIPEPMALDVLHEDEVIIVVAKPPGIVVHPGPGHRRGTLVNGLMHRCPEMAGVGHESRPGIVHRLDKDTSGVLVAAKTRDARQHLIEQFKSRTIRKNYLALVHGDELSETGVVTFPIGRDPADRKRMSIKNPNGREAETRWRVMERLPGAALLDVDLRTGRTHQIRVHFTAIGHPVVGDAMYGRRRNRRRPDSFEAAFLSLAPRQMLHAKRLQLDHPNSGERLVFEAPVPLDMGEVVEGLREMGLCDADDAD